MLAWFFSPILGPVSLSETVLPFWPVLAVGFLAAVLATPVARRAAFKFEILDKPNTTVKTHKQPTAYLGGVAVLVGFLAALGIGAGILHHHFLESGQIKILLAIAGGAMLSCLVGLIDDIKDIRPWQKLLGQAVCSLFLMGTEVKPALSPIFEWFGLQLPEPVVMVLTYLTILFFVLGASNSLNLLDGLDGLCTGVTAVITTGIFLLAVHLATWESYPLFDPIRITVAMALVGAALGFLIYNKHPAKIFLGDAGSILLGFLIATLMMLLAVKNPRWWAASVIIFGLPILDTGTALIRRALNHRPLFVSDRGHIYDQMIDRGLSLRTTVRINYLVSGLFALAGILGAIFLHAKHAVFVYLAIFTASFVFLGVRGYFRMSGLRGAVQKHL